MKNKIGSRVAGAIVTTIVLVVGGLAVAPAADAATPTTAVYTPSASQVAAAKAAVAQVSEFQSALSSNASGNIEFNASKAAALGGNPSVISQVASGIAAVGGVVSGAPAGVVVAEPAVTAAVSAATKTSCHGSTNYSVQWFGPQLKINSCTTAKVVAALAAGAALATIAAIILAATGVGGVAAGIIAGILAFGAAVLAYCSADGYGAIVDESWAGGVWCANQ